MKALTPCRKAKLASRLMKSREYLKKVLAERLTKSPKEELQCKR